MNNKNWAGNFSFNASQWHAPHSLDALQEIVARLEKIRAVGTKHSFNRVADSRHALVSLEHLNRVVGLDREQQTVTVEAGIRYGELCQYLNRQGFALHNLASLVHIGVAGACATATHGSGMGSGNLATAVSGLELMKHDGQLVHLSQETDGATLNGLVVGLGGFGVVTKLTLDIEPAFQVRQSIYENLPFQQVVSHFKEIMSSAYSVSIFTDWEGDTVNQLWLKVRGKDTSVAFPNSFFSAKAAQKKLHPVPGFSAENCTDQLGVSGSWHNRLQHFKLDFTPSAGDELQSEYLLPLENAAPALQAIKRLATEISPLLYTSEIRTVAPDNLWLSTAYKQHTVAIHFTWKADWPAVKTCLAKIESALMTLGARPHWGKLFTLSPEYVQAQYEMLPAFRELMKDFDPKGKFRNNFLDRYIYGFRVL